jgi:hypothetical protein
MNGNEDEYRRPAADAERQARTAKNKFDRAARLRITRRVEPAAQAPAER